MKVIHKPIPYGSGGDNHAFEEPDFEFMLFRQDWKGSERVYFNEDDFDKVDEDVAAGELPIHPSYSIIYAREKRLLKQAEEFAANLGCYATVARNVILTIDPQKGVSSRVRSRNPRKNSQ